MQSAQLVAILHVLLQEAAVSQLCCQTLPWLPKQVPVRARVGGGKTGQGAGEWGMEEFFMNVDFCETLIDFLGDLMVKKWHKKMIKKVLALLWQAELCQELFSLLQHAHIRWRFTIAPFTEETTVSIKKKRSHSSLVQVAIISAAAKNWSSGWESLRSDS